MESRSDNDVKGIVEEMAEDRGRTMNRASARKRNTRGPLRDGMGRALLFGLVAIAVLGAAFYLLVGRGERKDDDAMYAVSERLKQIEIRLERLESAGQQQPALIGRIEGLGESVSRLESDQQSLVNRLEQLTRRVESLADRATAAQGPEPAGGPRTTHTVQRGETLFSIAKRYGLTVAVLCELNGIQRNSVIRPGQKLVVVRGG